MPAMPFLSLDAVLFIIYLIINLVVGLWHSRKATNLQDYALGNRNFSTLALTATIVATWGSGNMFLIVIINTYNQGLSFIIPQISNFLTLLIVGRVLGLRMGEFLGKLSLAEAMDDLYGKVPRLISTLCSLIKCIGGVAMQFSVSAQVLAAIFCLEGTWATITAALIVIAYSSLGACGQ